jgi:hypothetical protein
MFAADAFMGMGIVVTILTTESGIYMLG